MPDKVRPGSLPTSTRGLILMLEKDYPKVDVAVGDLSTEIGRLRLAEEIGQRSVVDSLIARQDRSNREDN